MVGVLIRMRLRLLRNSFSGMQAATIGLGLVSGLALAAGGVWLSLLDIRPTGLAVDLLCMIFALWSIGWVIGPLFLGGSGGGLEPAVFASLPIRPQRLARGLLVVSFAGVGPVVTLAAFAAGVVYATRFGGAVFAVATVAMILQLLLAVLFSKVIVDLAGAAITSTSRAVMSALPWAVLGALVAQSWLLIPVFSGVNGFNPVLSLVLRVLPSGWGMVAVDAATQSNWVLALAALVGLVVLVIGLLAAWSSLIVHRTSRVVTVRPAHSRLAADRYGVRSGMLRRILPASPVGSVMAKELRNSVRDLNRAMYLSYAVFFGLAFAAVPLLAHQSVYLAAAGVIIALVATTGSATLYSNDGTALWLNLMTPGSERADVRGRQYAWLLLVTPLAVVCTVGGVLLSGAEWTWPWALSLLPAVLGGGAGLIVFVSVFFLVPVADPQKRARSAAGGESGLMAWAMLPMTAVVASLAGIVPLLGTWLGSPLVQWLGVPVGVAIGVAFCWVLGRLTYQRLVSNGVDLFFQMRTGTQAKFELPVFGRLGGEHEAVADTLPPVPAGAAIGAWLLYVLGAVALVAQTGVASILNMAGAQARTWFVVLYLPADTRVAGLVGFAVLGVVAVVGGWLLTRKYGKASRKRFYLP